MPPLDLPRTVRAALFAAALAAARPAAAAGPTYAAGSIPVAPLAASLELPIHGSVKAEVGGLVLWQGLYDDLNPYQYFSLAAPFAWLHWDAARNLRLSLAFQELLVQELGALGRPSGHEERFVARARLQQPRGEAALYELVQLDVRSFEAAGAHHVVFRPRFRLGQGVNIDAVRVHSLFLYEEVGLRWSSDGFTTRAFDFARAVAGYTWTTRRGTFVSIGAVAQVTLDPRATRYDLLFGPLLSFTYRIRPRAAEAATPPAPVDVELQ